MRACTEFPQRGKREKTKGRATTQSFASCKRKPLKETLHSLRLSQEKMNSPATTTAAAAATTTVAAAALPVPPVPSANRQRAANKNKCTAIVCFFDVEKYITASLETKSALVKLNGLMDERCQCGNPNPKTRYHTCSKHPACEMCYNTEEMVRDRITRKCTVLGCKRMVQWPPVPMEWVNERKCVFVGAMEELDFGLRLEAQRDTEEGARRRAAALGRGQGGGQGDDDEVDEADPAPAGGTAGMGGTVRRRSGPRRRDECTEEEWAEISEMRAERKRQKLETTKKLEEYPRLKAENEAMVEELSRLKGLLEENGVAYEQE